MDIQLNQKDIDFLNREIHISVNIHKDNRKRIVVLQKLLTHNRTTIINDALRHYYEKISDEPMGSVPDLETE